MIFTLNIKYRILNFILSTFFSYFFALFSIYIFCDCFRSTINRISRHWCFILFQRDIINDSLRFSMIKMSDETFQHPKEWKTFFTKNSIKIAAKWEKIFFIQQQQKKKVNATWSAKQKFYFFLLLMQLLVELCCNTKIQLKNFTNIKSIAINTDDEVLINIIFYKSEK